MLRDAAARGWWLGVGDALLVVLAWSAALLLRYDAAPPAHAWRDLLGFLPIVLVVSLLSHAACGLYSGVLKFASIREARSVLLAQLSTLVWTMTATLLLDRPVPLSVPIIATVLACGGAGALRFWSRLLTWRRLGDGDRERLVVIGGGEAGGSLVRSVNSTSTASVVSVLDDDRRLWGRRIYGVRVDGGLDLLVEVVERTAAGRVVLAISEAGPQLTRALADTCASLGVAMSIIPTPSELLGRQVSLQDVRDIDIADLLGRPQVDTDLEDTVALVRGRRVLVTGGGGSIGSELARQVASFGPSRLVLLDHDETHLFDAAATIPSPVEQCLADVRDADSLRQVFARERPEVVFHAAALKHVPLLESHAEQAVRTNIFGTLNVIAAAEEQGVDRLVFISTDKAVRPSSVMGATKNVGEQLVLGSDRALTACAVRFGNVLGSRGSVVPTFMAQIRAGGPVTITDARMTRYFMSIPEAVRLVLHAAALSRGGEIFMLDMGEPVRIIDLATRMIQLSGQRPGADIEVRVTEVRPGEKLVEQLHRPEEAAHATSHPAIVRLDPVMLPPGRLTSGLVALDDAVRQRDDELARTTLAGLVGTTEAAAPDRPVETLALRSMTGS